LQVAAFKSSEEADQMRARLAFMGYEAQISETKKDSLVFYRVRLGPYRSFEELNRAKTSLSDNGLESTVVRSSQ
jgi:cell division protein FtsN